MVNFCRFGVPAYGSAAEHKIKWGGGGGGGAGLHLFSRPNPVQIIGIFLTFLTNIC